MRSTEHVCLMFNQAWWMRLAIINMSYRKRVWTLESFFARNQSQSESEKNDTEEDQCVNQEETDEGQRKLKKSRDHTWLHYEKEVMFCYFCWKSKRTNPLHQQKGVQISVHLKITMSPKILAKGTNCPPVIKSYSSNPGHMYTPSHRDLLQKISIDDTKIQSRVHFRALYTI